MIVCVECKIKMTCVENGHGVRFGLSHVYPGDRYQCPKCHREIINTIGTPVHDPNKNIKTLKMEKYNEQ